MGDIVKCDDCPSGEVKTNNKLIMVLLIFCLGSGGIGAAGLGANGEQNSKIDNQKEEFTDFRAEQRKVNTKILDKLDAIANSTNKNQVLIKTHISRTH